MVLHIIILFKVEIIMLRFPFTPGLYNFAELPLHSLCPRILHSALPSQVW